MNYSYKWLKELSGTRKTAKQIAQLLTVHAFEVEGISTIGDDLKNVVVGEVLEMHKHPDADRLNVALVNVGEADNLQIVCGAPNLRKGQKVPVALVGAVLPSPKGDFVIKESDIRGVTSHGMICAESELGLGEDSHGIMVLHPKAKVGASFAKYLKLDDHLIDIDVLPNRGHDALAHLAMATEIAALEGRRLKTLYDKMPKLSRKSIKDFSVKLSSKNCHRYSAIKIEDVHIAPSPQWMQNRLRALGVQPINNVVDVTNYVMHELGQPLHAFDAAHMQSVEVRQARKDETLELLDDTMLTLVKDDLVITDGSKPTALAGVMGGKASGIAADTTEVILEAANFDAASVRYSRVRHNLNTDASYRFERDLDPNLTAHAAMRAAELIAEITGGKIAGSQDVYPRKVVAPKITVTSEQIAQLLGITISTAKIVKILKNLRCDVKSTKKKSEVSFVVTPPIVRRDLTTPQDLIEEVGRVYGYDNIVPTPPREDVQSAPVNEERVFERYIKDLFASAGLSEVRTYSFYDEKSAQALGLATTDHLHLINPMNAQQALMRKSLIPGVVDAAVKNMRHADATSLFTIGRVYNTTGLTTLPEEQLQLVAGHIAQHDRDAQHFYALKGMIDRVVQSLGVQDVYYDNHEEGFESFWHQTRSARIKTADGKVIGTIGELSARSAKALGLKKRRIAVCVLDFETLRAVAVRDRAYTPLQKYPTVVRDISMTVSERMTVNDVQGVIGSAGGELITDVDLFDLYVDDATGTKSFAFHVTFGADDRTLEGKEVDGVMSTIITALESSPDVSVKQ